MNINELFIETNLPEPLSTEELYNCFEKMKQGDMEAREKIINHNIKFVIDFIKNHYSNTLYDLEELVSVGLDCLIDCVDTFDINRGLYFLRRLAHCIYYKIQKFINNEKKYIDVISLNQSVETDKEGKALKVEDTLSDIAATYENNELYKIINKVVKKLPERDKYIVTKYFGFMGNKSMTQREIADELGLSQSNVSIIIKRALKNVSVELEKFGIIEKSQKNTIRERNKKYVKKMQTIYQYFNNISSEQENIINKESNELKYDDLLEVIRKIIETFPKRDKYVLMKYFGFMDNKKVTYQEIENELGIGIINNKTAIIKIGLKNIKNKLDVLEKIKTEMYYEYNEGEIAEMLSMLSIIKMYDNKIYEIIIKVIETLPERNKNIVMKYYRFIDNKPMTMSEIADELGISHQRVSQIIDNVLSKISIQLQKQEKQQNQNILIKNKNTNTK